MAFDAQAAAGTGEQGLRLFHPEHKSGEGFIPSTMNFQGLKNKFAEQRAMAKAVRGSGFQDTSMNARKGGGGSSFAGGPVEFQNYGNNMYGVLPKDYVKPADTGPTSWTDRNWNFSGVDKGWEEYDADWQKSFDPSQFSPGSEEWNQAQQRKMMYDWENANLAPDAPGRMIHSIRNLSTNTQDPRDPTGLGSDYAYWYDQAYGQGALVREANKYARGFAENDPAFAQYEQFYGDIDWNDAAQVEDWFRRAQMGGAKTAAMQSAAAQNKRTDLTEGLIMSAVAGGIGGMAGIGGLGSAWSNAQTAGGALNQFG